MSSTTPNTNPHGGSSTQTEQTAAPQPQNNETQDIQSMLDALNSPSVSFDPMDWDQLFHLPLQIPADNAAGFPETFLVTLPMPGPERRLVTSSQLAREAYLFQMQINAGIEPTALQRSQERRNTHGFQRAPTRLNSQLRPFNPVRIAPARFHGRLAPIAVRSNASQSVESDHYWEILSRELGLNEVPPVSSLPLPGPSLVFCAAFCCIHGPILAKPRY